MTNACAALSSDLCLDFDTSFPYKINFDLTNCSDHLTRHTLHSKGKYNIFCKQYHGMYFCKQYREMSL